MWALPWAGLGFLRAWQLQIPYMQLKALRESQVEAVSLLLTPPWESHSSTPVASH